MSATTSAAATVDTTGVQSHGPETDVTGRQAEIVGTMMILIVGDEIEKDHTEAESGDGGAAVPDLNRLTKSVDEGMIGSLGATLISGSFSLVALALAFALESWGLSIA
jgi:hypothetical protein